MILSHLNAGKALHKWGGGTKIGKIRQTDPFVIFFFGGGVRRLLLLRRTTTLKKWIKRC